VLKGIDDDFMGKFTTSRKFQSLVGLFSWIKSYFDHCPESLKPCIFYLLVFPMDKIIKRRRLLRRWIAESYCRDTSSSTAEKNGEKLISELADLSIIQHNPGKVYCQVNGFFREYIMSRPMEDNLVWHWRGVQPQQSACRTTPHHKQLGQIEMRSYLGALASDDYGL
jgi:hypothetical protein